MQVREMPAKASRAAAPRAVVLVSLGLLLGAGCASKALGEPGDGSDSTPAASAGGSAATGGSVAAPSVSADYYREDYPAGPYGIGVGATLEDFAFLGWLEPAAVGYDIDQLDTVHLSQFYNPDGRTDTKLIWINASAVWCSVCRSEMQDIKNNGVHAAFAAKGVQMIVTLFEDQQSGPAHPSDLKLWGSAPAHSIDFPLLLDTGFKLGAFFTSDATPLNLLVDAHTMKVIDATMGYSADYWQQVDKLLGN